MTLTIALSVTQANAQLTKKEKVSIQVDEFTKAILPDKSENFFQIKYHTYLKSGKAYAGYSIQSINGGKIVSLAHGYYDGLDGSCGQGSRKEMLKLEKIISPEIDLTIKDMNDDNYLDIVVEFKEEDCKTGKKASIRNIFYATENGFVLAEKHPSP